MGGGTLYNKITVGRRATLFNMSRLKTAAVVGAVASVGVIVLVAKLVT